MTEPTTDELARWAELTMAAMPGPWVNYERAVYEDRGILHRVARTDMLADAEFVAAARTAVPRLLALVAAQAEQIARHDDMRLANYAKAETDKARKRAEQAEVKLARVRALCDRAEFHAEHGAMGAIWPHDVRAILDGTEDPA